MKHLFYISFLLWNSLFSFSEEKMQTTYVKKDSGEQQLIVFTQIEDTFFIKNTLPKIINLAKSKKIVVKLQDAKLGLPEGITSTPCLVYQNTLGRSIYAARYTEFSTIENFIRTSRVVPQQQVVNEKHDVLTMQQGRLQVVASLKITPLQGDKPKDFDESQFEAVAKKTVDSVMQNFDNQALVNLAKTDRVFYFDIHPYLDKQGELFLTYELYSQFSCIQPVFSRLTLPVHGKWQYKEVLLTKVAEIVEAEILRQLKQSKNGDAISAVGSETTKKTWTELNLDLPKGTNTNDVVNSDIPLKKNWTYAAAIDADVPALQFRFMSPLDRYVGEVTKLKGDLQLNDNQQLISGIFEVETNSVTMGIPDFDEKIHKKYIKAYKFPKATFRFNNLSNLPKIAWNKTTSGEVYGDFTMVGKTKKVAMQTQLTPTKGDNGETLLLVQATFSLNITDDFGINGPDGPEVAKKTMNFNLNFYVK
jgi:polyisoprenoid-binding protein YceI